MFLVGGLGNWKRSKGTFLKCGFLFTVTKNIDFIKKIINNCFFNNKFYPLFDFFYINILNSLYMCIYIYIYIFKKKF